MLVWQLLPLLLLAWPQGGYVAAFSRAAAPALQIRPGSASPSPTWCRLVPGSGGALEAAARIQKGRRAALPLYMSGSADDLLKSAAEAIEKEAPPKPAPVAATKPGGWEGGLGALRDVQAASGGVMEELTFEAPEPAMKMLKKGEDRVVQALSHFGSREGGDTGSGGAQSGLKLYDLSHWGVIEVQGDDRLTFLNGQCTANIKDAVPMDAMRACFTNKVGRVLDYCAVACLPDRAFVVTSPSTAQLLMQQLDFLIIREKVSLSDLVAAGASGCFSLAGAGVDQALGKVLGDAKLLPLAGKAVVASVGGHDVVVVHGSGLASEGYLLIASSSAAAPLWEDLLQAGAIGEGYRGYEAQRISDGVPAAGSELTLDYNPLEAGLWSAVSFEKGCYCGQETLARLRTYDGVKQHLWNLAVPVPSERAAGDLVGRKLFVPSGGQEKGDGERAVGLITSSTPHGEGQAMCLCYVKGKAAGLGDRVELEGGGGGGELVRPAYYTGPEVDG